MGDGGVGGCSVVRGAKELAATLGPELFFLGTGGEDNASDVFLGRGDGK